VLLACAIIFIIGAHSVARRVSENFPWSGGWDSVAAVVATIGVAAAVSLLAVMVGELLAIGVEVFRVGNGHLSYRTGRVPWTQHRLALFLVGIVLFLLVAIFRHAREDGRPTVRAPNTRR
jgi:H+/Cl- antiporter ClcA